MPTDLLAIALALIANILRRGPSSFAHLSGVVREWAGRLHPRGCVYGCLICELVGRDLMKGDFAVKPGFPFDFDDDREELDRIDEEAATKGKTVWYCLAAAALVAVVAIVLTLSGCSANV